MLMRLGVASGLHVAASLAVCVLPARLILALFSFIHCRLMLVCDPALRWKPGSLLTYIDQYRTYVHRYVGRVVCCVAKHRKLRSY